MPSSAEQGTMTQSDGVTRYTMTESECGSWVLYADHARIVAQLRQELAEAKATLERLSAPVSIPELKRRGVQGLCAASSVIAINRLIAARATPPTPASQEGE